MTRRAGRSRLARLRRAVQVSVLLLFFALLLAARPVPGRDPPGLLHVFFHLDPLIGLTTALSAHAIETGALLALLTVLVTLVLGRVFCGWFCPLGTVHAFAGRILRRRTARGGHTWSRWQLAKYVVLAALLIMAAVGTSWLALFDPLVILYRTTTTALWPAAQGVIEDASIALYHHDPGWGDWRVTDWSEPAYRALRDSLFVKPGQAFLGTGLLVGFFALIVGLNAVRPRFWCRYVCPLGALLGLLAWRPWLRRRVEPSACNQCGACGLACAGAAAAPPGTGWNPRECLGCLNCNESCPQDGLGWTWRAPWRGAAQDPALTWRTQAVNAGRRHLLAGTALGLAGAALLRSTPASRGKLFHPDLIRPPGARPEPEFLARCTACGLCMKICPTGGLQPTVQEAGLAGLWTPRLVPRLGYCDFPCHRCGSVCPTQAIQPLALAVKQTTRIGLAVFDTTRCLPYAFGRDCMVCEEHCPVPTKAITFQPREVVTSNGQVRTVQQPRVDPELCIGCGICEYVCPFKDRPAIRVSSANEARHPANQPILPGATAYP